jgi:glycosyltransferase involved in cell wall biosynthesis
MLNALYLAPGVSGGPETYLRGLVPALAGGFPDLRLTVATTRSGAAALNADGWRELATIAPFDCEDGQRARRQWAEQVELPRAARAAGAQIVHSLASIAPIRAGARSVVTLHDVTFLLTDTFGPLTTFGMGTLIKLGARRADALITATQAARGQICSVLGIAPARLAVVPHGYAPAPAGEHTPAELVRDRYELDAGRVVLCVAAKRPHKNQELLVRAARLLPDDVLVVLAGHPEPYEQTLRRLARELGVQERVRFVGYVPDADLEGLWDVCACAAFPTLGEGFGIPVLEAFAHGVPVAASDLPVLREVGGELPHYFDPRDPASAAQAIRAAMQDAGAAAMGPAHARRYSWQAAAQGTNEVYERVLHASGR